MSSLTILGRSALSNWLGFGFNIAITFLLSPIVVSHLGSEEYGAWLFISAATGYLALIESGVTVSVGRLLNFYLGRDDRVSAISVASTAFALFIVFSLLLILFVLAASRWIAAATPQPLGTDGDIVAEIVLILTLNIGVMLVGAVYTQLLHAANRFDLKNLALVTALLFRCATTIVALNHGAGLLGLAWIQFFSSCVSLGLLCFAAAFWGCGVSIRIRAVSKKSFFELLGFGKWAFTNNVATRAGSQSGVVVTGSYLDAAAVAHFGVAQMLVEYGTQLVQSAVSVANPDLVKSVGRGDFAAVRHFVDQGGRVSVLIGVPVLACICVLGPDFVSLWLGAEFANARWALVLLAAEKSCFLCATSLGMAIWAIGEVRLLAIANVVCATLGIALSMALLSLGWLGLEAAAFSALLVSLIQWMVIQPLVGASVLRVPLGFFYRVVVLRYATSLAAFSILLSLMHWVLRDISWSALTMKASLSLVLYLPVAGCALWGPRRVREFAVLFRKSFSNQSRRPT